MEFFDRKQEVLDIQLTPLGKRLMQMGRLKPEFYAFYDNDIMYDGQYAGITETQNNVEERIKEVPRIKQQTYLYSAEQKINKNTSANDLPIFQENLFESMFLPGTQQKMNPESIEEKQRELLQIVEQHKDSPDKLAEDVARILSAEFLKKNR